jgi:hypothetical protein
MRIEWVVGVMPNELVPEPRLPNDGPRRESMGLTRERRMHIPSKADCDQAR